jgi:capsular polysaccharide biosynthesis protein/MinD-like ATPase involved in chromosome partitioning or flagellar assembly
MLALPAHNDVDHGLSSPNLGSGLRQHVWTIFLVTVIVTVAAVLFSLAQPARYTSAASIVLQDGGETGSSPNMATEKQIASSNTVTTSVIHSLGLDGSTEEASSGLSISVPVDTNVLVFSYTSTDPKEAQRRAQGFADAYLSYRHQALLQATQAANQLIDVRISELENELKAVTRKAAAAKHHGKAEALRVTADALFAQIGVQEQRAASAVGSLGAAGDRLVTATIPTVPSQPRLVVNGLLGLFFGLSLGTFAALWQASFRRRVQTEDDVEQVLNMPVLAVIPRRRGEMRHTSTVTIDARSPVTDAYRELVARLLSSPLTSSNGQRPEGPIQAVDLMARTIAVVGFDETVDSAEIAANLGAVVALSGRSVLVVSTAANETGSEGFLGSHAGPGMTDVMRGHAELADAIRPTAIEGLRALPTGTEDRSWILLDAERVHRTVGEMNSLANIVIVHAAAHPGAGSTAIVAACDAILYVGALRSTSMDEALRVRSELQTLGKPTLGAVMFERRRPHVPHRDVAKPKRIRRGRPSLLRTRRRPQPDVAFRDPPRWKALRHVIRSRLSEHPKLYLPFARRRYPGPSPEVIGPDTELVIDGYTRSACTFAVYALQLAQQAPRPMAPRSGSRRRRAGSTHPPVRLAHHLHAPAQLLEAARRGIPTLVVIREPEGAILSQLLQEPHVSLRDALVSYERFYSSLLAHGPSFVAGEFKEVTRDFGSVIRRVNKRFGTHYRIFDPKEDNIRRCFDLIKERPTTNPEWRKLVLGFESGTVSLDELLSSRPAENGDKPRVTETWIPSEERSKAKDALRERWNAPELAHLRERALATYHEFLRVTADGEIG